MRSNVTIYQCGGIRSLHTLHPAVLGLPYAQEGGAHTQAERVLMTGTSQRLSLSSLITSPPRAQVRVLADQAQYAPLPLLATHVYLREHTPGVPCTTWTTIVVYPDIVTVGNARLRCVHRSATVIGQYDGFPLISQGAVIELDLIVSNISRVLYLHVFEICQ